MYIRCGARRAMESSNEDVELLRPKDGAADRASRWPRPTAWAALSLAFAGAGCLALALRPMLRAGQEPRELLANSQTGFYSSGGDLVKHFQIQQDRVPVAVIDFIWPGLNVEFQEGEGTVTAQSLSDYTFALLTGESPFGGTKGEVRVPAGGCCSDQLNWGEYVAYTRKQVCYLAALVAAGNEAADYDSGLSRLIPPDKCDHDEYEAGFKRSLLGLLAACSVDPTLKEGQGPVLIVAKSTDGHDPSKPSPALDSDVKLEEGSLRTCRFRDGSSGNPAKNGMAVTEPSACSEEPPVDFMRAGNKLQGQVMVDITAAWIGGYILAHKGCGGVDGGQDERLMTTMPEVMVLSFFMSAKASPLASEGVALLVPAYIIGARRIFAGFDGTSRDIGPGNFNAGKPAVNLAAPMTSDLASVELHGGAAQISATSPFLGFQSINQQSGLASDVPTARLNQNPIQFEMDGDYGFPEQVKAWYNAVALTHWHPDVQGVLRTLAVSIGSGPWGSGEAFF
ncbi:unnamed protein product [Effrenium voratum]|nr:unnamed protein product [Effrenium voratum]